jgi:hypothetical protein
MASHNAIVPTKCKKTLVSTASQKSFSKPATPRISDITSNDLCDHCSRFDFGDLKFSSESLDVYQCGDRRGRSGSMYGSCPLCKLSERDVKCYRYESSTILHGNCPSGRVVFFWADIWGGVTAFVHKVPAEDSLPCAI